MPAYLVDDPDLEEKLTSLRSMHRSQLIGLINPKRNLFFLEEDSLSKQPSWRRLFDPIRAAEKGTKPLDKNEWLLFSLSPSLLSTANGEEYDARKFHILFLADNQHAKNEVVCMVKNITSKINKMDLANLPSYIIREHREETIVKRKELAKVFIAMSRELYGLEQSENFFSSSEKEASANMRKFLKHLNKCTDPLVSIFEALCKSVPDPKVVYICRELQWLDPKGHVNTNSSTLNDAYIEAKQQIKQANKAANLKP